MDKLKTLLTVIAAIIGVLVVLSAIGFIYSLVWSLMMIALICLAGYVAFRLLSKPKAVEQLRAPNPQKELQAVQRILDQYKKERQ
ncbi:MAG TPA: hypothetical protein VFY34_08225 [Pyrinomonadaceae bacterium]|nr:hypothetical protein [Pyrinomonadaceae bacterium]